MKDKMLVLGLVFGSIVLTASGCATASSTKQDTGLANPASVHCEEQGYTLEARTDENGTYGVCVFPDGSESLSGCDPYAIIFIFEVF